jgi:hypothetical protein
VALRGIAAKVSVNMLNDNKADWRPGVLTERLKRSTGQAKVEMCRQKAERQGETCSWVRVRAIAKTDRDREFRSLTASPIAGTWTFVDTRAMAPESMPRPNGYSGRTSRDDA